MAELLAETWNSDELGQRLWTREWYHDEQGFYSQIVASGAFVPAIRYFNEKEFWIAFENSSNNFSSRRFSTSSR